MRPYVPHVVPPAAAATLAARARALQAAHPSRAARGSPPGLAAAGAPQCHTTAVWSTKIKSKTIIFTADVVIRTENQLSVQILYNNNNIIQRPTLVSQPYRYYRCSLRGCGSSNGAARERMHTIMCTLRVAQAAEGTTRGLELQRRRHKIRQQASDVRAPAIAIAFPSL